MSFARVATIAMMPILYEREIMARTKKTTSTSKSVNVMKNINDDTFLDILQKSEKPVFVLFTTDYSGLSQTMFPRTEEASRPFQDKIEVYRARGEESKNFIARFGIKRVPTLAVFKNNKLIGMRVNLLTPEQITKFMDSQLESNPV